MKKAKEFRDQPQGDLAALLKDTRHELFELRNQRSASKKLEKPHQIRHKRREIARILTVLNEKNLENK